MILGENFSTNLLNSEDTNRENSEFTKLRRLCCNWTSPIICGFYVFACYPRKTNQRRKSLMGSKNTTLMGENNGTNVEVAFTVNSAF